MPEAIHRSPWLVAVLFGGLPWFADACSPCRGDDDLGSPQPVASGVGVALRGVGFGDRGSFVAVGDSGVIAYEDDFTGRLESVRPVNTDLRAVTPYAQDGELLAVGTKGVMLSSTVSGDWSAVDVGTSSDLWAVIHVEQPSDSFSIAVGDEVVLVRAEGTAAWEPMTPPEGGWGRLRGVFAINRDIYMVGLGGVIWSAGDPREIWTRNDSGTENDLLAVGGSIFKIFVGGVDGTLLQGTHAGVWEPIPIDASLDLVDIDYGDYVLARDGRLLQIRGDATGADLLFDLGFHASSLLFYGTVFYVAGEGGQMRVMQLGDPDCD